MKKKLILNLLILLGAIGLQAQNLGKLAKDKLKTKAKTETPAPNSTSAKPGSRDSGVSNSNSPLSSGEVGGAKNSTVSLDFDSERFKPAVLWSDLLSQSCWYFNATTADLRLNNMEVSFLPKKTKSGKDVTYESYNNPTPLLRMEVIEKASGNVRGTLYYGAKATTAPFQQMQLIEKQGMPMSVKMAEGEYELKFWAGDAPFYTFPFKVEKLTNTDPYSPVSAFYHLSGPWEDWGYVDFGPDGHFIFNFYHTYQTTEVENAARWDKRKPYKTQVKLNRDGKMVGVYRLGSGTSANIEWNDIYAENCVWKKFDMTFHSYPPPTTGPNNRPFFLKENMKDGNYTVEVLLKDEKSGQETAYKYAFTVKDNNIVPPDKADRSKNPDNMQLLEQGRKTFFVKKI
ncbi:MAG: hypothetical protein GC192_24060 [Bacteroidetes bacterium]|nr:hypothetical protein [Bacteroidota bacterium]